MSFPSKLISVIVEGPTDVPVARRLLEAVGLPVHDIRTAGGKAVVDSRLKKYAQASRHSGARYLMLRDLDQDAGCAPEYLAKVRWAHETGVRLQLVVRSLESWLMADREALADFLHVAPSKMTRVDAEEGNPKLTLVNLARYSRNRSIREDMVPSEHETRPVGLGFNSRIMEFGSRYWRPLVAEAHNDSLHRCLACLRQWKAELS